MWENVHYGFSYRLSKQAEFWEIFRTIDNPKCDYFVNEDPKNTSLYQKVLLAYRTKSC